MLNPWQLPMVLAVNAKLAHYQQPMIYYVGRQRKEARDAVEIEVQTADEFPVRALSLALFIGDVPVIEYCVKGPNQYRFYAFEFQNLQQGAPVSLGWPQMPSQMMATGFRYQLGGGPVVA
jgi:hypothetical protein